MPDLDDLATRLPKDRHYSGESPTKEGLPGFVCPRADAYGGREGIIPPGVAAVNGLVPKGMRRIATADTAKSANAAREDGRTEAERYLEYYASARVTPPSPPVRRPSSQPDAAPARPEAKAQPVRRPAPRPIRPPSVKAAVSIRPARVGGRLLPGAGLRVDRVYPSESPGKGMFSHPEPAVAGDDTLDGFYDGLAGEAPGTGERDIRELKKGIEAGVDLAAGEAETVVGAVHPGPPRVHEPLGRGSTELDAWADAMSKMAEEKAALRQQVEAYEARVVELERAAADVAERDKHYAGIEDELRKASAPAETVRVALAVQEERLKIGGQRWECKVLGALHVGREGRSAVLTVSDPAYASELLAEIRLGALVVLSGEKRTYCTYNGHCAKIYAEPDSQDFITAFWLSVEGSDAA